MVVFFCFIVLEQTPSALDHAHGKTCCVVVIPKQGLVQEARQKNAPASKESLTIEPTGTRYTRNTVV